MAIIDGYRPYQQELHIAVQQAFRAGHRRIMAMSPTGSGKTILSAGMIERSLQTGASRRGKPALFIVPRITLAAQAARSFYDLGLTDLSILQADHPAFNAAAALQVCSAQTLEKRADGLFSDAGLIVIDEAHIKRQFYTALAERWPNTPIIGLSATPTSRGLGKIFTELCVGATTAQLVGDGYLVPSKVYEPSVYDVTGVAAGNTASGYNEKQLAAAISGQREIHGHVVQNWIENGGNRPTLCFPVNCDHSREIVAQFIDNGVPAMHIDANTELDDRQAAFDRLVAGDLRVISSVGCLTEGLDIPEASCVIAASPVKSLERHVQMVGRSLRKPGEAFDQDAIIFDHGGNYLRLMHHEDYAPTRLDKGEGRPASAHLSDKAKADGEQNRCSQCAAIKRRGIHQCEYCGHAPAPQDTKVTELGGALVNASRKAAAIDTDARQRWYQMLMYVGLNEGYRPGWAFHKFQAKFDERPPREWNSLQPVYPSADVDRWVTSQRIRYAKGRKKAELAGAPA